MIFRVLDLAEVSAAQLTSWFRAADAERQARTLRKKQVLAQKQSVAADHLARTMLAEFCGCTAVEFCRAASGRLTAPALDCDFNLSHSGNFVACAVHERAVGIDIEATRKVRPQLVERICCAAERDYIFAGGSFDSARFLQVWTAKEAVLKLRGTGICTDLRAVAVVSDTELRADGLRLHHESKPNYTLCVAFT